MSLGGAQECGFDTHTYLRVAVEKQIFYFLGETERLNFHVRVVSPFDEIGCISKVNRRVSRKLT